VDGSPRSDAPAVGPRRTTRVEYYRHGTLSLCAALDVKTGQVHGMTARRRTSQEFIAFLKGLVARTKWGPGRFTSFSIICRRSRPRTSSAFWPAIHTCSFTSRRPTHRGSGRTLVRQDPARCHPARGVHIGRRSRQQNSANTFALIPSQLSRSVRPTLTLPTHPP
jgi:hypothetical protein